MKIAIVTPHAVYNYGAVLQAFGLYTYLSETGNTVYMYDLPPHTGGKPKRVKEYVYACANKIGRITHNKELKLGDEAFNTFIKQFYTTKEKDLPLYIVGSDQVWNPDNIDDVFSLSFVDKESIKASYAASMGVSTVPEDKKDIFINAIEKLDFLSAREVSTVTEVEKLTGRKCRVDVDPSFLLERKRWEAEERKVEVNRPYILVYLLHIPENIKSIIESLRNRFNCDIIMIDRSGFLRYGFRNVSGRGDIGPREFLWLINHAEYVITSSFHGTAFSIIYNKQFKALINQSSPSRISYLLHITGIDAMGDEIDYKIVTRNMQQNIDNSKKYLSDIVREER